MFVRCEENENADYITIILIVSLKKRAKSLKGLRANIEESKFHKLRIFLIFRKFQPCNQLIQNKFNNSINLKREKAKNC